MRLLFLDDSGKVHPNDSARVVVYGGISIDASLLPEFHRRVTGLKAAAFPGRSSPNDWELKSKDFVLSNTWKRKKNRDLCLQLARILGECNCKVYAVAVEKSRAKRPLTEEWIIPLMFQRLVAKFAVEVADDLGMIICDWGSYKLDGHISTCVQSYAVSRGITTVVGGATYASSHSYTPIQAADLIAAAFRHSYEGRSYIAPLIAELSRLQFEAPGVRCVEGWPVAPIFNVF